MNPFRETATETVGTDDYPDFYRAGGDMDCPDCGKKYNRHPMDERYIDWDGYPWLRRLCSGQLIKT